MLSFGLRRRAWTGQRGFPAARLRLEMLEDRQLLSAFTVVNAQDFVPGSLRQAILDSNAQPGPNIIDFNIGAGGAVSIDLALPLPVITSPVFLNGLSQPGGNGTPLIHLVDTRGASIGLRITAGSSTVEGLVIQGFSASGIILDGAGGDLLTDNYIGISGAGALVGVSAGAGNTIRGNVIAGNGVGIECGDGTVVQGNLIGTDPSGTVAVPNGTGVEIDSADAVTIGGTAPGARNVISGNTMSGISLNSPGSGVRVQGNFVGTNTTGDVALPNGTGITATASHLTIGGTIAGAGNVIAGNRAQGILLTGGSANLIQGNFIGTDAAGNAALGNGADGVAISDASGDTVGGTAAAARNVIAGNSTGISVRGTGQLVQGNFIGTDVAGTHGLINQYGVVVMGPGNTIGGTMAGTGNLISGNNYDGILLSGPGAQMNLVQGNFIGTDVRGAVYLGNSTGIAIAGASNNVIGGNAAGAGNTISGNRGDGILIGDATGNVVAGNLIGTDASGTRSVSDLSAGVFLSGANNNLIGGTASGSGNVISGNGTGIAITTSTGNQIQGNRIGTDVTGTRPLANNFFGVWLSFGAEGNLIGGTVAGARNIISANAFAGLYFYMAASNNLVQGNFIGTDVTGTRALGNSGPPGDGIVIASGNRNNTIGGIEPGAGNLISGNDEDGVVIADASTVLQGNSIGTDVTGTRAVGNLGGVAVAANDVTIGGTEAGAGNLISGNQFDGIYISGFANAVILGNRIGTDVTGTQALGNGTDGIFVYDQTGTTATIGGTEAGAGNLISGNLGDGIAIQSTDTTDIVIQGNSIGTDLTGMQALGNTGNGVTIMGGTNDNTIARNLIAFNGHDGVAILGGTGNAVLGNAIFGHDNGLGIELADGGNNDQEFPLLTLAVSDGSTTTVAGTLTSAPSTTFTVELFVNPVCNPSGYGEGEQFLGALPVTTDADGNATFSFTASIGVDPGQLITATATDPAGNTSEFSACAQVTNPNSLRPRQAVARSLNLIEGRQVLGVRPLDAQGGLLQRDHGIGIDAVGQPDAGADDGVVADDRVAAEDGGVGVDDDVVLQRRVALHAADDVAGGVAREAQRPQRHALVQLHVAADVAGLTDDDAGAVVDEEARADAGPRVDVDARA